MSDKSKLWSEIHESTFQILDSIQDAIIDKLESHIVNNIDVYINHGKIDVVIDELVIRKPIIELVKEEIDDGDVDALKELRLSLIESISLIDKSGKIEL